MSSSRRSSDATPKTIDDFNNYMKNGWEVTFFRHIHNRGHALVNFVRADANDRDCQTVWQEIFDNEIYVWLHAEFPEGER